MQMTINIGIDPGFGATGVVATDLAGAPLRWLVISHRDARQRLIPRANGIADAVVDFILKVVEESGAKDVAICIETPIYNGNPAIFTKQLYLLALIETYLWFIMAGSGVDCTLNECNPTTSKRLATGNPYADKQEMIKHSPFHTMALIINNASEVDCTVETLADSWAHSLSARDEKRHSVYDNQTVRPVVLCQK